MIFINCDVAMEQLRKLEEQGKDLRDYMIVDCDEDERSAIIVCIDDFADDIVDNIGWTDS